MSGGVKNIKVSDCQFLGTDVGLRFKSTRGRGGVVENIYIDNMSMFDIQTDVITFDLYYGGKSAVEVLNDGDEAKSQKVQKFKVDETTPCFRNIDINHVICRTARRQPYRWREARKHQGKCKKSHLRCQKLKECDCQRQDIQED